MTSQTISRDRIIRRRMSRRIFLGSMALAPRSSAEVTVPIPVTAINHMTISVSDPARSLEWYQGLFGMPIAARQGNTVVLRVGNRPQFIAIGGRESSNPRINHLCLSTENFDDDRIVRILGKHGVASSDKAGPMEVRIRLRGPEFGGAAEGTPELYFGDPDGIVIQLQEAGYCGGTGPLGDRCMEFAATAQSGGPLTLHDYNHFTLFVTDQQRSIAFYQQLFGMPIDTYQGQLPVLRVGAGNQFLALAGTGKRVQRAIIHHACLTVDDLDVDRVLGVLSDYGVTPRDDVVGPAKPLTSYVIMRMPDRGGAPGGTPELYFTDPDGILIQLQDTRYCGGNGYLGNECGTAENPTGRNG